MTNKKIAKKTPKKTLKLNTLIFLMIAFVIIGQVILPYFNRHNFDADNPAPSHFPVVEGKHHPSLIEYTQLGTLYSWEDILRENTTFKNDQFHSIKLSKLLNDTYEIEASNELYTFQFKYQLDEKNQIIIPIYQKATGLITWIWATVYLVVLTVLILVGQLIWFWWKSPLTETKTKTKTKK